MTFWESRRKEIYVKLYDDLASSLKTKDEVAFYARHFSKSRKIIEFGCGTGRTLVPLLEAGFKVSGLDISGPMLKILRRKLAEKDRNVQKFANRQYG